MVVSSASLTVAAGLLRSKANKSPHCGGLLNVGTDKLAGAGADVFALRPERSIDPVTFRCSTAERSCGAYAAQAARRYFSANLLARAATAYYLSNVYKENGQAASKAT